MMATPKKTDKQKSQKRPIEHIPTDKLVRSIREDLEEKRRTIEIEKEPDKK
jgi:hypothetical protein